MKRKRGNKKGKQKQSQLDNVGKGKVKEDNVVLEDEEEEEQDVDNDEMDSDLMPIALESDEQPKLVIEPHVADKLSGKGQGRVKVKLKSTEKIIEPHSDADKSSSHLGLEKKGEEVDKLNDAYFLPKVQQPVSVYTSKKAGGIRIKSSKHVGLVNTPINIVSSPLQGQGERTSQFASDMHKSIGSSMSNESLQKEHRFSHHNSRHNQEELNTALGVIQKIMKMDAAEPFNAPVDPIALGIPDYFDIIKTPMDFGTICNNLQGGNTYRNSEDVYKDVQYIWENCIKYNNKGDYIVDLMKRVKKNFMKYWSAAGLYTNQSNKVKDAAFGQDTSKELHLEDVLQKSNIYESGGRMKDTTKSKPDSVLSPSLNASEGLQVGTMVPSSQEKMNAKGTYSKQKKRGRHGFNKHKSDCLCAVCVVRRRRMEREEIADVVETQIDLSDGNMSQEFKQEESSIENRCNEDVSSNLGQSLYPDADVDMEEQGQQTKLEKIEKQGSPQQVMNGPEEVEIQKRGDDDHSDQAQLGDGSGEEPNPQSRSEEMDDSPIMIQKHNSNDGTSPQDKEGVEIRNLQQKHDSQMMQQQAFLCKNLLLARNHSVEKLCGALFPSHRKSVWSGPHSLGHHDFPVRKISAIHSAVDMFMK